MTEIKITPKYSEVKPSGAYVYRHRRMTDGSVFYIGKGNRDRGWQYSKACQRSDWWIRTAKKNGVTIEIVKQGMSDTCAMALEKILIHFHRKNGDRIVNISSGGDGSVGFSRAGIVFRSDGDTFASCAEASRHMMMREGIDANVSKIWQCASGRRLSAYGYNWSFTGRPMPRNSLKDRRRDWYGKRILCSNGIEFRSIKDASDWVRINTDYKNASSANISACARGVRPRAYGLTWSFIVPSPSIPDQTSSQPSRALCQGSS